MVPNFSSIHKSFKLNGESHNFETLKELAYSFTKEGELYQKSIGSFLLDWLDTNDFILVKTSGSTGNPKEISLQKQAMVESAFATGTFFNLPAEISALHCLPTNFIAGKMMLVRAIVLGWHIDLVEPTSKPLFQNNKRYHFAAMVPLQLQNSIDKLNSIDSLIVGGAAVSMSLQKQILTNSCKVYATYGMTETITHIAAKQLNGHEPDDCFKLLPDIVISKDDRDCLVINAPRISNEQITTNDIVELCSSVSFRILGRFDNVINSGGVKLFPEQIEQKLQVVMSQRFFVASENDEELGERLILIVEGKELYTIDEDINQLSSLNKYEIPKRIYHIPQFIETDSGKIQRTKTLALLKK